MASMMPMRAQNWVTGDIPALEVDEGVKTEDESGLWRCNGWWGGEYGSGRRCEGKEV